MPGRVESRRHTASDPARAGRRIEWHLDCSALRRGVMPPARPSIRAGNILVVEDHPGAAKGLQALLRSRGHRVDVAADADQALERIALVAYGLVVTDLDLGADGGTEIVARLRRFRPALPMLVVSARDRATVLAALPNAAHVECLEKPVDPARLLAAVESGLWGEVGVRHSS